MNALSIPEPNRRSSISRDAIASSLESMMLSYSRSQAFYANLSSSPSSHFIDDNDLAVADESLCSSSSQESLEQSFIEEETPLLLSVSQRRVSRRASSLSIPRALGGNSSFVQTCFNAVNVLMGIGILSLPLAMYFSGWIIGIGLLIFVCFLTNYTAKLLAEILDLDEKLITYADIGYVAFGPRVRYITSLLFMLELAGASVALVILMGDSLHDLFPEVTPTTFKLIGMIIILPTTLMPLSVLSFTSLLGIFSTLSLLFVVIADGLQKHESPGSLHQPMSTTLLPEQLFTLPLSFGLMMAGFAGHAVFPNIKVDMKSPERFNSMCNLTYAIAFSIYLAMGVCGYAMFGNTILDEITQSLMRTPGYNPKLNKFAVWLVAINPLSKFALTTNPIHTTIEMTLKMGYGHRRSGYDRLFTRIGVRLIISLVVVIVAITFPGFDRVMSLLGAATGYAISAILPILFHMSVFGRGGSGGRYKMDISKTYSVRKWMFHSFLLFISISMALTGTIWSFFPRL